MADGSQKFKINVSKNFENLNGTQKYNIASNK
jgi:hypothetical protein